MNLPYTPKSDKNIIIETEFDKLQLKNIAKKTDLSQVFGNDQISNIYFDNTLLSDSVKLNFDNSKSNKLENYTI